MNYNCPTPESQLSRAEELGGGLEHRLRRDAPGQPEAQGFLQTVAGFVHQPDVLQIIDSQRRM